MPQLDRLLSVMVSQRAADEVLELPRVARKIEPRHRLEERGVRRER